jgi:hypothetical protein
VTLIDLIHDFHTSLALTRDAMDVAKVALEFPLKIRCVGERTFVERNFSANCP